jgi:hypothetical protein
MSTGCIDIQGVLAMVLGEMLEMEWARWLGKARAVVQVHELAQVLDEEKAQVWVLAVVHL